MIETEAYDLNPLAFVTTSVVFPTARPVIVARFPLTTTLAIVESSSTAEYVTGGVETAHPLQKVTANVVPTAKLIGYGSMLK